jgi:hypothetical protein
MTEVGRWVVEKSIAQLATSYRQAVLVLVGLSQALLAFVVPETHQRTWDNAPVNGPHKVGD